MKAGCGELERDRGKTFHARDAERADRWLKGPISRLGRSSPAVPVDRSKSDFREGGRPGCPTAFKPLPCCSLRRSFSESASVAAQAVPLDRERRSRENISRRDAESAVKRHSGEGGLVVRGA